MSFSMDSPSVAKTTGPVTFLTAQKLINSQEKGPKPSLSSKLPLLSSDKETVDFLQNYDVIGLDADYLLI